MGLAPQAPKAPSNPFASAKWGRAFRWVRGLHRSSGCSEVSWETYDMEGPTCPGQGPMSAVAGKEKQDENH